MILKIKYLISFMMIFGFNFNLYANTTATDNYFKEIKSVNLIVSLDGEHAFCGVRESAIRTAVGYTLSNSPLKKIDRNSSDILHVSVIAMRVENQRGLVFGCATSINFELWRFASFKGARSIITVWNKASLLSGDQDYIVKQLSSTIERETKEFVAKWGEQN